MDGLQELFVPEYYQKPAITILALLTSFSGLVILLFGLISKAMFGFCDLCDFAELVGMIIFIHGILMICLQHDLRKINYKLTKSLDTWHVIKRAIIGFICIIAGVIVGVIYIIFTSHKLWVLPLLGISMCLIIMGCVITYTCFENSQRHDLNSPRK